MKSALRLLLPLSIVLAACGGGGSVAATVNGTEIAVDDVRALLSADGAVDAQFFRTQLQGVIVATAVLDIAESEYGITATDEEVETQYQEFKTQLEASAETYEAALASNGITDERVRQAAREQIVADALRVRLLEEAPPVTDEEVAAELEANSEAYRSACISHILLETEEEAVAVKDRLDSGEDFATVAGETSIEPQAAETGGDLGCSPLNRYVPEFAIGALTAEVGVVTDPVQSEFGYHLILVASIDDDATVEEAIRTQLQTVAEGTFFQEWIQDVLTESDITVDDEYGTWVTDPVPGIEPPATETTEAPGEPEPTVPAGDDSTVTTAG